MKSNPEGEKPIAVYGAIIANTAIAVTKFIAAAITGSSAMISEGIHSLVDTGNQLLLLLGIHTSKKPADDLHPFGHGKNLYFWGLIVAIVLFGIGGGMAIYEGILHLFHPARMKDPTWNYVVLALAFIFEGISGCIAVRELLKAEMKGSFWRSLLDSKDPAVFTVVAEDSAALAGLIVAALGVFLSHQLNNPYLDGAASIIIGLILSGVAVFLVIESQGLLIGESIDRSAIDRIRKLSGADPGVVRVRRPLTMHFGPSEVLLTMDVEFNPNLSTAEIIATVDRLQRKIQEEHPEIKHIYIEAASLTPKP